MAKIWRVYEGGEPTIGGPWIEIPALEAISVFKLKPKDFLSDLERPGPKFGDVNRDQSYGGYRHIIVQFDVSEGRKIKWKSGFYRSEVRPLDAHDRLIDDAFESKLGEENVIRVEKEDATDSLGREALKIIVILKPGATKILNGGAALDAQVVLQQRLHRLQDNRVPMIHYATEAELEQDVGS